MKKQYRNLFRKACRGLKTAFWGRIVEFPRERPITEDEMARRLFHFLPESSSLRKSLLEEPEMLRFNMYRHFGDTIANERRIWDSMVLKQDENYRMLVFEYQSIYYRPGVVRAQPFEQGYGYGYSIGSRVRGEE